MSRLISALAVFAFLVLAVLGTLGAQAKGETRVALVVGNGNYGTTCQR